MQCMNMEEDGVACLAVDPQGIVKGPLAAHAKMRWCIHMRQVAKGMGARHDIQRAIIKRAARVDRVGKRRHRSRMAKHKVRAVLMKVLWIAARS